MPRMSSRAAKVAAAIAIGAPFLASCGKTSPDPVVEVQNGGVPSAAGVSLVGGMPSAGTGGAVQVATGVDANDEGEPMRGAGGVPEEPVGPRPYRALQIVTGQQHGCALLEDHRVKCWGDNFYGQLGLGDVAARGLDPSGMGDALPFVELGTDRTAKSIAAGRYGTCALLDDRSVKCWGMSWLTADPLDVAGDEPSEMGDALPTVLLGDGRSAIEVAIGYHEACVALDDGRFACGQGGGEVDAVPSPSSTPLLRLFGGGNVLLGLFEGGTVYQMPFARWVADGVVLAAASERGHCFVETGGTVLYYGSALDPPYPQQLPNATALGLSWEQNLCAVVEEGRVDCFGAHVDRAQWARRHDWSRISVPLDAPAVQLTTGAMGFQCALLATGRVTCWDWTEEPAPAAGESTVQASSLVPVDLGTWHPVNGARRNPAETPDP